MFLPLVYVLGVKKDTGAVFLSTPTGFIYNRGMLVVN
jgi:hypothetical protein